MDNCYLRTCATLDRNVFPPVRTRAQGYFGSLSAVSTIPLTRSHKMTLGSGLEVPLIYKEVSGIISAYAVRPWLAWCKFGAVRNTSVMWHCRLVYWLESTVLIQI